MARPVAFRGELRMRSFEKALESVQSPERIFLFQNRLGLGESISSNGVAMQRAVAITGWGHYVPDRILTNRELESLVDTSDEWIRTRTGIQERHIAAPGETTSSMCILAARQALERAALASAEVDLVICATTTPDHLVPATACLVQKRIGAVRAGAFDVNAAC